MSRRGSRTRLIQAIGFAASTVTLWSPTPEVLNAAMSWPLICGESASSAGAIGCSSALRAPSKPAASINSKYSASGSAPATQPARRPPGGVRVYLLEALGNPTRLRVYRALVRAGDSGLPVGRLQSKLDIAASTLSHHLHRLILTSLVTQERRTTTLICRANYPMMDSLIGFLSDECCADAACGRTDTDAAA
jgi:ArsR family transcriptional regulator, arsenate/arsenite/antimonite-responsive transcriptional repressor